MNDQGWVYRKDYQKERLLLVSHLLGIFFFFKIMLKNTWQFCNSISLTLNAHLFMALSTSDILPKECAQYCLLHLEN